jgi:hypothetical protein
MPTSDNRTAAIGTSVTSSAVPRRLLRSDDDWQTLGRCCLGPGASCGVLAAFRLDVAATSPLGVRPTLLTFREARLRGTSARHVARCFHAMGPPRRLPLQAFTGPRGSTTCAAVLGSGGGVRRSSPGGPLRAAESGSLVPLARSHSCSRGRSTRDRFGDGALVSRSRPRAIAWPRTRSSARRLGGRFRGRP